MTVFARIDHGAAARAVGLELPEEELLLMGGARVGTLLMQEDAEVGSELPLRVLVWAGPDGVRVGFPDPEVLASAFRLDGRIEVLARMRSGLDALVAEATA
ncbi:MAG TPA: DUF302 domain-containing protein [Gaiellaceae bacterium]|nr:DUF302 domain-containing protein [Gaiellaceae bacterium]